MVTIEISEETDTTEDMTVVLERIIELIRQGYKSGYEPTWSISDEEEEPPFEDIDT